MKSYKEPTIEHRLQMARESAFEPIAHMNREARRTANGRRLVAEAEARALRAENEVLRNVLAEAGIT